MLEISSAETILHTVLGCWIQANVCGMSVNESQNVPGSNIFFRSGIPHFSPDNIENIHESPLKGSFKGNSRTFIVLLVNQGQQEKHSEWLHPCFFGFVWFL